MTGHSIHHRSLRHIADINGGTDKTSNSMWKHNNKYHPDDPKNHERFEWTKVSTHRTNMSRLLTESYLIQSRNDLMNSKLEYGASKWINMDWSKTKT